MGYSLEGQQRNRCYLSIGKLGFSNFSALSGIDFPDDARAIATTDWDQDGDVDVIMTSRTAPRLRILMNQLVRDNSFLRFSLYGTESNRDAIGSRVDVYLRGRSGPLSKTISAGSGYLTQSSKRLCFGLGKNPVIDKVVVTWPNGKSQTCTGIQPNTEYRLIEGQDEPAEVTNERFRLVSIQNLPAKPAKRGKTFERSAFYPQPILPNLEMQQKDGRYYSVAPTGNRHMLLVLWTNEAGSLVVLRNVIEDLKITSRLDLEIIALYVDENSEGAREDLYIASEVATKLSIPFRWGTAPPSSVTKIKAMMSEWFSHQDLGTIPFAFLVSSQGNVCAFYPEDQIEGERMMTDINLTKNNEYYVQANASIRQGIWINRHRKPKLQRTITTLQKLGFVDDANSISRHSRFEKARELVFTGKDIYSRGDLISAKEHFENAIQLDPDCVTAFLAHGQLLQDASKLENDSEASKKLLEEAAECYANVLDRDPLNTEAIIGRADVEFASGNTEGALKHLKEYLEIDPERYEVHAMVGRLLFMEKRYMDAAKYLIQAFDNRPTLPFVAGDLGVLYLHNGQYRESLKFLNLAHRLQPSEVSLIHNLAEANFWNKKFEETIEAGNKVVERLPTDVRIKSILAWVHATCPFESCRDAPKALELIEPIMELFDSTSPMMLEIYAACLAENGQFEQAVEVQQQAMKLAESENSTEIYSNPQLFGLETRLKLYQRKRPYRMSEVRQIPFSEPKPL